MDSSQQFMVHSFAFTYFVYHLFIGLHTHLAVALYFTLPFVLILFCNVFKQTHIKHKWILQA